MKFRLGDTYKLQITLSFSDGTLFAASNFSQIIFKIGEVVKTWTQDSEDEVKYNGNGQFILNLSQEETFAFGNSVKIQAMLFFADGPVRQTEIQTRFTSPTLFKEKKRICVC